MRTARACVVLLLLVAVRGMAAPVDEAVRKAEADRIAVIARAREAAVAIFAPGGAGGGSGVLISADGYALSNFHVTKGSGDAMKCGLPDGKMYDAVIVGFDPVGDVALIKLLGRDDFPHAELGDSDQVQVGDWAFAVGNPFLLATDFTPSVSYGIISGTHRYQYPAGTLLEYTDCLQTDASINPGNSGGPLFDSAGRLIGINGRGSFEKRGRVNVGVGYAISINQIKNFLGHLKGGRIVDHATLGARVGGRPDGRVTVTDILEDCDAFRRGLRHNDEVVSFAGRSIHTVNAFKNVLGIFPKDWTVPLSYRREGQTYDVLVRLEGVHSTEELLQKVQGRVPSEDDPDRPGREQPDNPRAPRGRRPRGDKPGDKPEGKPGEKPDGQPDDIPRRPGRPPAAPEMPAEVKAVFEPRRGFANYYFNKHERKRTWDRCVARGDFHDLGGEWLLRGELARGGEVELRITDAVINYVMPGTPASGVRLPIDDDLTSLSDPPGSGGMFAALYAWRRLLVLGPEKFGDVQYLGTVPVALDEKALGRPVFLPLPNGQSQPAQGLCDALIGTYGGAEIRVAFDPTSGNLAVLELYRAPDDDPCELHFDDYAEAEGRMFPREIEVCYGDNVYATLKFDEIKLARGEAK